MQNLWKNPPEDDPKRGSIINQLQANTAKRHHDTCLKLQINAYFYKLSIRQEKPCQETQMERKRLAQHNNMIREQSPDQNNNAVSCKQGKTWGPAGSRHPDTLATLRAANFLIMDWGSVHLKGAGMITQNHSDNNCEKLFVNHIYNWSFTNTKDFLLQGGFWYVKEPFKFKCAHLWDRLQVGGTYNGHYQVLVIRGGSGDGWLPK